MPISENGGYPFKVFSCDEDVWDVIKLLIAETKEINDGGKSFDIASSISQQLPHFCCMNIILDKDFQKDISKYLYCQKFSTPPFPGNYGTQPFKWISKAHIIESALTIREQRQRRKIEKEAQAKRGK